MTVAQLAIAWVLVKGKDIVPSVGARKRDLLDESSARSTSSLALRMWSRWSVPFRRAWPQVLDTTTI